MASETVLLKVKVIANASKNEITGWQGEYLKIKLMAQREKGKANLALIEFLSQKLLLPKSAFSIVKGTAASFKTIAIENSLKEAVFSRLPKLPA